MNSIVYGTELMNGDAIEIHAIADADGTLAEDSIRIRKSDDCRHFSTKPMTEQLINFQSHFHGKGETLKLLIVRIGGNLCHGLDTKFT